MGVVISSTIDFLVWLRCRSILSSLFSDRLAYSLGAWYFGSTLSLSLVMVTVFELMVIVFTGWIYVLLRSDTMLRLASNSSSKRYPFIFRLIVASLSGHLCSFSFVKMSSCMALLKSSDRSSGSTPATFFPLGETTYTVMVASIIQRIPFFRDTSYWWCRKQETLRSWGSMWRWLGQIWVQLPDEYRPHPCLNKKSPTYFDAYLQLAGEADLDMDVSYCQIDLHLVDNLLFGNHIQ